MLLRWFIVGLPYRSGQYKGPFRDEASALAYNDTMALSGGYQGGVIQTSVPVYSLRFREWCKQAKDKDIRALA